MEISNITQIIDFTSTLKYFEFCDEPIIQTHGKANGKYMAPTYANMFMWNFEKYLLDNCTDKSFLYLRHVDDIFVIRQHGEDKLEQFHAYDNSIHPNIKLTSTHLQPTYLILMSLYRLTAIIYTQVYMQNPLIDMDTSISSAFTQYT